MGSGASIHAAPRPCWLTTLSTDALEHLCCFLPASSVCAICTCCQTLLAADTAAVWACRLELDFGLTQAGIAALGDGPERIYRALHGYETNVVDAELLSRRVKQASSVAAVPRLWTLSVRLELCNPFQGCAAWFIFGAVRPGLGSLWAAAEDGTLTMHLEGAPRCFGYSSPSAAKALDE